ncbi:MAG: 3D domain-containing protein [Huintestinicola sp.]
MNKIREIFSQKLKLSGIRGCMAAGAMTAGIAALAVIGGINSEDISTVNLETDVIPEETAAVETEKKSYSHDMEYFSLEDMEKMSSDPEEPSENEAAAEAAKPDDAEEETAAESSVTEEPEQSEEPAVSEEETEDAAAEDNEEASDSDEAYETLSEEEISEDIPRETSGVSEETNDAPEDTEESEPEQETSESVSARLSAAGGDDDNSGLSSALDFDTVGGAANGNASDEEMIIIIDRSAPKAESAEEPAENEEASAEAEESDIPRDISLEDEQEEEAEKPAPGPQEGAISLFDLPEWLEFDENGIPTEYTAVLTGKACAYTAAPDALMSTGKAVFQGYVAVDPDVIPYGTELYIVAEDGEVYGYAIAADTGYSVRKGHIIVDLFMNEYDDCIQWGNKPVYVYVLR